MEEKNANIVLLTQRKFTSDYLEDFFLKNKELQVNIQICPLETSQEQIFLRYTPQMLIVDFVSISDEERAELNEKLKKISDLIPVIGIIDETLKPRAIEYVKLGVRDFIQYPFQAEEIASAITHFRNIALPSTFQRTGKAYTFLNFKGGVGNTFLAVNTAVTLARLSKKKVLLWDMALQSGDVPFFLNCDPKFSLVEIIQNLEQVDESYLRGVLPPTDHGVAVLPAPRRIEDMDQLTPQSVEKALHVFLRYFDYVVIDGGNRLSDSLMPILDGSCNIFLTSTLELIALRGASRCLGLLEQLRCAPEKIKVLINRYNSKYETITKDKAEEILRYGIAYFFGNDYSGVCQSVNLGQAVIDASPGSPLNHQFKAFVKMMMNHFVEEKKQSGLFSKIRQAFKKEEKHVAS